jgi:GMP synthase-like glutamine amidotransferase
MRIGIVNMHKNEHFIHRIIAAMMTLGCKPVVIDGLITPPDKLVKSIKSSPIRHWIFSGSQFVVTHPENPQVPLELLNLDKKLMLICYSMESVLLQLGFPVKRRYIHRRESFNLVAPDHPNHPLFEGIQMPMKVWRDHTWYTPKAAIHTPVRLVASYNGETMIATYKNATLVQHHPEHTADGRKFLENWLKE